MPSTMIHLLVGRYFRPDGCGRFFTGCFAPDCVNDGAQKTEIHLRGAQNRLEALRGLKNALGTEDPFSLGWLLHLYTDFEWDSAAIHAFKAAHAEENWFLKYREEIGNVSFALFHSTFRESGEWAKILDEPLAALPAEIPVTAEEILAYRSRIRRVHSESAGKPPAFFAADYVDGFALRTAKDFEKFTAK